MGKLSVQILCHSSLMQYAGNESKEIAKLPELKKRVRSPSKFPPSANTLLSGLLIKNSCGRSAQEQCASIACGHLCHLSNNLNHPGRVYNIKIQDRKQSIRRTNLSLHSLVVCSNKFGMLISSLYGCKKINEKMNKISWYSIMQ